MKETPKAKPGWSALLDRLPSRRASAAVEMFRNSAAEAQRSRLPQMAAALSYRTIFGLIPVMVVALVALRFFATDADVSNLLSRALSYSGLSSISIDESKAGEIGPFLPDESAPATAPAPAPATAGAPGDSVKTTGSEHLDRWIQGLVAKVSAIDFKTVGLIGLAALIYAAISMLVEIERAFNQIYRVPVGRSWARRITQYWTLLTLGSLGLGATFWVGQKFTGWLEANAAWEGSSHTLIVAAVGYMATTAISTLLFLLAYTVVPNTRVKIMPALAGAVFAALLWEAGKWGFSEYIHFSTGLTRLYGSLALVPLFLLWVYVTWVIVLFGLNFSYYLQYGRHHTRAQPSESLVPAIVDPAATLALMGALARRFESGQSSGAKGLSGEIGVQEPIVRQMLERLSVAGLILPVKSDDASRESLFTLARPPERIEAEQVLRVGEELAGGTAGGAIARPLHQARLEHLRGRSLAAFLAAGEPVSPDLAVKRQERPVRPSVPNRET